MFRFFALTLATTGLTLGTIPSASANECNSVDTCSRAVLCASGFTRSTAATIPNGFFCSSKTAAQTVLPICTTHNTHSDWVFASGNCTRTRKDGVVVTSRENLDCPAGANPVPSKANLVSCQIPESTSFAAPVLANPGAAIRGGATVANQQAATHMLICTVGSIKTTGGNFFCERNIPNNLVEDPTCANTGAQGAQTWTWDAGRKSCTRKSGTETLYNTSNITCKVGGTYESSVGKCLTPKGTTYAAPTLVKTN
jgi:hypothetical protein